MSKPTLRLGFSDTFLTAERFFVDVLGAYYDIIRDDENPKYLIFGDSNFGQIHNKFNGRAKKIFYTGENVRPDYLTYNHAITFDLESSPKHYRLPLYVLDMFSAIYDGWTKDYYYLCNKKIEDPEKLYERGFCSFVQSNPRSNVRNDFFAALCQYKKVDSAGPHLNNVGFVLPRDNLSFKIDFLRKYRFNLAFENQTFPGYVTEKILNAFYADTVPIYWGSNNEVDRDFNKKAFINSHDLKTFDGVMKYVMHLDSPAGKNEYLDMLTAPCFVDNRPNCYMDLHQFYVWFNTFVYEG